MPTPVGSGTASPTQSPTFGTIADGRTDTGLTLAGSAGPVALQQLSERSAHSRKRSADSPPAFAPKKAHLACSTPPGEGLPEDAQAEAALARFSKEVASHLEMLRRRDSTATESPRSRLAAAISALFEYDSPALKAALVMAFRDADPATKILWEQFSWISDGKTVTHFDDVLGAFRWEYRNGGADEEKLSKDISKFQVLVDACKTSPDPKIQKAPDSYVGRAAAIFVRQLLLLTPESEDPDREGLLQSVLKSVEANRGSHVGEQGKSDALILLKLAVLARGKLLSSTLREAVHDFEFSIARHLPESKYKYMQIGALAMNIPHIPSSEQLLAFIRIMDCAADAAASNAGELFFSSQLNIPDFSHEIGGKVAIEVVKAAAQRDDANLLFTVLDALDRSLFELSYSTERIYFDSLPDDDRIEYFATVMNAFQKYANTAYVQNLPGVDEEFGLRLLNKALPLGAREPAEALLDRFKEGETVDFLWELKYGKL